MKKRTKQAKAPVVGRVQTVAQIVAWLKVNKPDAWGGADGADFSSPKEAALWFCAYRYAQGFHDFKTKDFASMVLEGMKPMKAKDFDEELKESREMDRRLGVEDEFDLTEELKDFWLGGR